MKLSLFSVSYAGYWGQDKLELPAFIGKAASLGYDAVMIAGKRPHLSPLDSDADRIAADADRLYGLGSADMKSFLAIAMEAAQRFRAEDLARPHVILATADEETSMDGARALATAGHKWLGAGFGAGFYGLPVAEETVGEATCYKVVFTPTEGEPMSAFFDKETGELAWAVEAGQPSFSSPRSQRRGAQRESAGEPPRNPPRTLPPVFSGGPASGAGSR